LQFVVLKGHNFKACPEPVEGCRPISPIFGKSINAAKPRPESAFTAGTAVQPVLPLEQRRATENLRDAYI
jgi:hypothetical protein